VSPFLFQLKRKGEKEQQKKAELHNKGERAKGCATKALHGLGQFPTAQKKSEYFRKRVLEPKKKGTGDGQRSRLDLRAEKPSITAKAGYVFPKQRQQQRGKAAWEERVKIQKKGGGLVKGERG